MNPERFPKTGAGAPASAQICMRLTRSQLAELDRAAAEEKLTRSQVVRRALKAAYLKKWLSSKRAILGRDQLAR